MTSVIYFLGSLASLLVVVGTVVALVFLCGSVGMDGLFSASEPRGELTCWHCNHSTRAGVKRCDHCGGELQ